MQTDNGAYNPHARTQADIPTYILIKLVGIPIKLDGRYIHTYIHTDIYTIVRLCIIYVHTRHIQMRVCTYERSQDD